MKQSKEEFDGLVARIRAGENFTFGQAEKLFAEAFLKRFLKQAPEIAQGYRRAMESAREDEDSDEDVERSLLSLPDIHVLELELLRSITGTLGVRPSIGELSNYVERALGKLNWDLLEAVLSVSKEGKLEPGRIEQAALEVLTSTYYDFDRDKDFVKTMEERFGTFKFTQEVVDSAYQKVIGDHKFSLIDVISKETSVPPSDEVIQSGYEQLLETAKLHDRRRIKTINSFQSTTGKMPVKSPKFVSILSQSLTSNVPDPQEMDQWDRLVTIYRDDALSADLQKAFLEADNISLFCHVAAQSTVRLHTDIVRSAYAKLDTQGRIDDIASIAAITKVIPDEQITAKIYQYLFDKGFQWHSYKFVADFAKKTGTKPILGTRDPAKDIKEIADTLSYPQEYHLDECLNLVTVARLCDLAIDNTSLEKICMTYLEINANRSVTNEDAVYRLVDEIYAAADIVPSVAISQKKAAIAVRVMMQDMPRGTSEELVHELVKRTQQFAGFGEFRVNGSPAEYIYNKLFSKVIHEIAQGKNPNLSSVGRILDTPATTIVGDAIHSFVNENYTRPALSLFARLKESGIPFPDSDEVLDRVVGKLCNDEKFCEDGELARKLDYLLQVSGQQQFSIKAQADIHAVMTEEISFGPFEKFDSLLKFHQYKATESEAQKIQKITLEALMDIGDISLVQDVEEIVKRTGIPMNITDKDLHKIIEAYFINVPDGFSPNRIAKALGKELDPALIQNRYKQLLAESSIPYGLIKKIRDDTGIPIDREVIKSHLQSKGLASLARLREWGFEYTPAEIQDCYATTILSKNRWEKAQTLYQTCKVPPTQEIFEKLFTNYSSSRSLLELGMSNDFIKTLVEKHQLHVPDAVAMAEVNSAFQTPGTRNIDLIKGLNRVVRVYHRDDIITEESAKQAVVLIDTSLKSGAVEYSTKKFYPNDFDISVVYDRAGAGEAANAYLTELLEQGKTFAGYAYSVISGARPISSRYRRDKLEELKADIADRIKYHWKFTIDQTNDFIRRIDNWMKEC